MSDNHTDAQGELPEEMALRRAAEIVAGGWFDGNFSDVQARFDELATPAAILDLFRATEGQAQTSAAADYIDAKAEKYLEEHADIEPDTGAAVFHYGEAGRDYHSSLVELAEEIRAAQLADSTAPGAPANEPSVKLMMELGLPNWSKSFINGFKLNQDGMNYLYRHPAAPTAQQSPRSIQITLRQARQLVDFFGGHDADVTVTERPTVWEQTEEGLYAFCTEYPEDGAQYLGPTETDDELMRLGTAQQSLTAGGAEISGLTLAVIGRNHFGNPIPKEWYAAAKELIAAKPSLFIPKGFALMPLEPSVDLNIGFAYVDAAREADPNMRWSFSYAGYRAALKAGQELAARALAAAPLPQVQSEALENAAKRVLLASDNLGYAEGGQTGRYELEKACEQLERALANHPPVTPSGALADNDGGVK